MTKPKLATQLTHLSSEQELTHDGVNPTIQRTSSVIFPDLATKQRKETQPTKRNLTYGRHGTNSHFALSEAVCQLEGAAGCKLYPSGVAAISGSVLPFLTTGDHILVADAVYSPMQDFCRHILPTIGVEYDFFDANQPDLVTKLIKANTKVIYLETPSSVIVDFNDAPKIVQLAKQINPQIVAIIDNTWAAGVLFKPLQHGFDISLQSGTKYLVGHSDYFIGLVAANSRTFTTLAKWYRLMGIAVDPDTAYMALRGLRTLAVRLHQHFKNSTTVAQWLSQRPEVHRVNHPALTNCSGLAVWQQYFTGGNGLFFCSLTNRLTEQQLAEFIDNLKYFKIAYSWGGFESLILAYQPEDLQHIRLASQIKLTGSSLRLHIGLEDPADLIDDLAQAFSRI